MHHRHTAGGSREQENRKTRKVGESTKGAKRKTERGVGEKLRLRMTGGDKSEAGGGTCDSGDPAPPQSYVSAFSTFSLIRNSGQVRSPDRRERRLQTKLDKLLGSRRF